jgi:hypothetical protein
VESGYGLYLSTDSADGFELAVIATAIHRIDLLVAHSKRQRALDIRRLDAHVHRKQHRFTVDGERIDIFRLDFAVAGVFDTVGLHLFDVLLAHLRAVLADTEGLDHVAALTVLVIVRLDENTEDVVLQAFPFVSDDGPPTPGLAAVYGEAVHFFPRHDARHLGLLCGGIHVAFQCLLLQPGDAIFLRLAASLFVSLLVVILERTRFHVREHGIAPEVFSECTLAQCELSDGAGRKFHLPTFHLDRHDQGDVGDKKGFHDRTGRRECKHWLAAIFTQEGHRRLPLLIEAPDLAAALGDFCRQEFGTNPSAVGHPASDDEVLPGKFLVLRVVVRPGLGHVDGGRGFGSVVHGESPDDNQCLLIDYCKEAIVG